MKDYRWLFHPQQFAPKCHHCATAIVDSRFVTINDPTLGQRYYHELHFFCAECGDPFLEPSKSSAAGTEFLRSTDTSSSVDEEEDQTKEFVIHGKYAFCEECHVKLHKPKCKGCRKPIRDVAVGALGGKWHRECFTCTVSVGNFSLWGRKLVSLGGGGADLEIWFFLCVGE
jgi:paxillin